MSPVLLIGATEERQIVLVDVLGNVEAVGLNQLLVIGQLVLGWGVGVVITQLGEKKRQGS